MFKNKLSEGQQRKITKSNARFKKKFKYSTSYVITGFFIISGAILGIAKSQGVPIGDMGLIVVVAAVSGILGGVINDINREFDKEMDKEITEPENDLLSSFLKQSTHTKLFNPEVFEKLTVLKLTKDERLKDRLFQDIVQSIDKSVTVVEKPNVIPLDKPIVEPERKSFLTVLEAAFKDAKYDLTMNSRTIGKICESVELIGGSISKNTVSKILEQVRCSSRDRRS